MIASLESSKEHIATGVRFDRSLQHTALCNALMDCCMQKRDKMVSGHVTGCNGKASSQ